MIKILLFSSLVFLNAKAFAQEFGMIVGVHQTEADTNAAGYTIDGQFNWKAGLAVEFLLADVAKFRTGAIYNTRHFESTQSSSGLTTKYNFAYLDVPANVQYNINDMFGVFGGLVIAVKASDDVETPAGITATDPDMKGLIPLVNGGVNMMFDDMIGFDVYFERGLGKFAKDLKDYSTFGANFIYLF